MVRWVESSGVEGQQASKADTVEYIVKKGAGRIEAPSQLPTPDSEANAQQAHNNIMQEGKQAANCGLYLVVRL